MSKNNSDFFSRKSEWATIKDDLLAAYLEPYFMKIFSAHRPLLYIDGFAGKGRFDDGEKGSPLIACEMLMNAQYKTKSPNPVFDAVFIEREYADDLSRNLQRFDFAQVLDSEFGVEVQGLESLGAGRSLFLYVDPYGIKHLNFDLFARVAEGFESAEVLINFNSFGFIRAACRVYGIEHDFGEVSDEFEERDPWRDMPLTDASRRLSAIVGGDYWKEIIQELKEKRIDGYEAEIKITEGLCGNLFKKYRYVLNIPIRLKESNRPKYRMIHLTNHRDGCLLMYENMQKRLQSLFDIQYESQGFLFPMDSDNNIVDIRGYLDDFENLLLQQEEAVQLEDILADFVMNVGLSVPLKDLRYVVKDLEQRSMLEVKRNPATTKLGKPTRFLRSSHGQQVFVRRKA